jgi:hypothetical protein
MKSAVIALAVLLLVVSLGVQGSPVELVKPRIGLSLLPFRRLVESRLFEGRAVFDPEKDRANVIAIGQEGASNLGLYVYDVHGNCVAWDDLGSSSTRDDVAVEWFPMQKERYTIELRNLGAATNRLDLIIR